jgi:hypothetical protein
MLYRIIAPDRAIYDELKAAFKDARIELDLPRHLTIAVENLDENEKRVVRRIGGTFVRDYQYATDLTP